MALRPRNHTPAFKAKVALAALKGARITLPMTWDSADFSLGRTPTDVDHTEDLSLPRSALGTFGKAHLSFGAQMRGQLLLEHPSRRDEQTAIDRFTRYPQAWIAWVFSPSPLLA